MLRRVLSMQSQLRLEELGDCPVCLSPLLSSDPAVVTSCSHFFCRSCIERLFARTAADLPCPICRQPLHVADLRLAIQRKEDAVAAAAGFGSGGTSKTKGVEAKVEEGDKDDDDDNDKDEEEAATEVIDEERGEREEEAWREECLPVTTVT